MKDVHNCCHTDEAIDVHGNLQGSWQREQVGRRIKIACGCCDVVYGYLTDSGDRDREEDERRYRAQIALLSCPGCGESPFLG